MCGGVGGWGGPVVSESELQSEDHGFDPLAVQAGEEENVIPSSESFVQTFYA